MSVHIIEEQDPEVLAMLQAFYSRSLEPIESRMQKLRQGVSSTDAIKNKLKQFYVGYGHSSIADCGFVTLFLEGYSILAIKALQNTPLYNGQESSTRYISLSGDVYAPNPQSKDTQQEWLEIYESTKDQLVTKLGMQIERPSDVPQSVYEKTITARSLDIARSLIPCGALTNASWTTSLRKLHEHTVYLLGHPLQEVRQMASDIRTIAHEKFPNSMPLVRKAHLEWLRSSVAHYYSMCEYEFKYPVRNYIPIPNIRLSSGSVYDDTADLLHILRTRPERTPIPSCFNGLGTIVVRGMMDFGTWRDLQRHRQNTMRPFLVEAHKGFHNWYKKQFKDLLGSDVSDTPTMRRLIKESKGRSLPYVPEAQYACPMGIKGEYQMTMGFAQAIYIIELRTAKTVHPILRHTAQQLATTVQKNLWPGSKVYADMSKDTIDFKRGNQDIVEKNTVEGV